MGSKSKDNVVRFRMVTKDGRRSTTWRVFDHRGKSDIYLLSRPLGDLAKVSLHESGKWRTAFLSDAVAARYLPSDANRAFDMFSPPLEQVAPGWIEAFAILLPDSELQPYGQEKNSGPVIELGSPGPDKAFLVSVLLGEAGSRLYPQDAQQQAVGSFTLADGRQVLILAESTDIPAHIQVAIEQTRKEAYQAAVERGLDLSEAHPVHPLILADDRGNRLTIETAAWSVQGQPR